MRGKHITVADVEWVPYFIVNNSKTGNDRYTGYDVELLKLVAAQLNFTYTIVEIKLNATIDNWENVLYQAAQRYDLVMSYWTKSEARMKIYPYTWVEHLSDSYHMVGKHSTVVEVDLLETLYTFLKPFSYDLWLAIIGLLVVQGIILYYVETSIEQDKKKITLKKAIFLTMFLFCGVGGPEPGSGTGRIQLLSLGFTITVILAVIKF